MDQTIDPDNDFTEARNLSAHTKAQELIKDTSPNAPEIVEQLLWRRVLEARLKLMHDYLIVKEGIHTKDSTTLDLDADVDKHSRAIQAYQTSKEIYNGIGKLSANEDTKLLKHAAEMVTASEDEQQTDTVGDNNLPRFTSRTRSDLAEAERALLEDLKRKSTEDLKPATVIGYFVSDVLAFVFGKNILSDQGFGKNLPMEILGSLAGIVPLRIIVPKPTMLQIIVANWVCDIFMAEVHTGRENVFAAITAFTVLLAVFLALNTAAIGINARRVGTLLGGELGLIIFYLIRFFGRSIIC